MTIVSKFNKNSNVHISGYYKESEGLYYVEEWDTNYGYNSSQPFEKDKIRMLDQMRNNLSEMKNSNTYTKKSRHTFDYGSYKKELSGLEVIALYQKEISDLEKPKNKRFKLTEKEFFSKYELA